MKFNRSTPLGQDKKHSRIAMVAIVLFLFFDLAALALNVWLSWKIEQQAIAINLSGRQRMLSQRMVKVLLQIDNSRRLGIDANERLQELQLTFDLFDNTLRSFDVGNQTRGGANEIVFLPAVTGDGARAAVEEAVTLWAPYRQHIQQLLTAGSAMEQSLLQATIADAEATNLKLLSLMNTLTTELERQTQHEAGRIRTYQGAAFSLALINFLWAFVMYRRRLSAFSRSHNLLDDIIDKISASVLVIDGRNFVLKANQTAEQMFEYAHGEILGKHLTKLINGKPDNLIGHRKSGSQFIALCEHSPAILDEQPLQIVTVLDVTKQRQTEEHLSSLAYHDILTRLPNRLLFDDLLRIEINRAKRNNLNLAVLFIDLDKFKPVNDQFGHEAGDQLLQDVAVRMKRCLRESDIVARRGGDEFTVIATEIGSHENCEKIAQVILAQLSRPFHFQEYELNISCSIGISLYPTDAVDPEVLICRADEAMYNAKQSGRNTFRFFDASEHSLF